MTTPTIIIQTDEITPALERVWAALENPLPLMQHLGEYFVKSTIDRFPSGRAPDGSVWAPKSPVTIAAQGGRRTNRLDTRPLFGPSGALSSTINYEAFPDRVEWGSPMVYAAMQQFGGSKSAFPHLWGDIPARPFLGVSAEDEVQVLDIIGDYLSEAAGEPL
ncbi:MAG: phage virion morphogenesis protein [Tabrizicola sp.]|jgi:phage virion morphogenesis protein|nr:phage virion morphogenesis protein [Tabrizicola sp.]